jgi:hypothetical protein
MKSAMNKKAVSEVMGYLMLISFAIIMSVVVYQGLKTYVPVKASECPEGVSIFGRNVSCSLNSGGTYDIALNVKNNGRHNIAGYFIHASYNSNQTIATNPLIGFLEDQDLGVIYQDVSAYSFQNAVIFEASTSGNFVNISSTASARYRNIPKEVYSLDILPVRFQKEENKLKMVSCGKAMVREKVICGLEEIEGEEACTPVSDPCGDFICGTAQNGTCGAVSCGAPCSSGFSCDAEGQCISLSCTPVSDPCGDFICGTAQNGTCGSVSCGTCNLPNVLLSTCPSGLSCIVSTCIDGWCNTNGINSDGCEAQIGTNLNCGSCGDVCLSGKICSEGSCTSCNGAWISPEDLGVDCDGTPKPANCLDNCTCTGGYVSSGTGGCEIPSYVTGCDAYCIWLTTPIYTDGTCRQNEAQCVKYYEIWTNAGDLYCETDLTGFCCCKN